MLVLVLRAQSCGLEGKDKPDKRIWVGFVGWNADLWLIITLYIWSVATFAGDMWTAHKEGGLLSQIKTSFSFGLFELLLLA